MNVSPKPRNAPRSHGMLREARNALRKRGSYERASKFRQDSEHSSMASQMVKEETKERNAINKLFVKLGKLLSRIL